MFVPCGLQPCIEAVVLHQAMVSDLKDAALRLMKAFFLSRYKWLDPKREAKEEQRRYIVKVWEVSIAPHRFYGEVACR